MIDAGYDALYIDDPGGALVWDDGEYPPRFTFDGPDWVEWEPTPTVGPQVVVFNPRHVIVVDEAAQPMAKHYGPGPHPGTGTPQSVHAGKGDYLLDPMFFGIMEQRMWEHSQLDQKIPGKQAVEWAKGLLEKHGITTYPSLDKVPSGGKGVVVMSKQRYFEHPYNPDASAFVTGVHVKGGDPVPGVYALIVNPRHARQSTVFHEVAHVLSGDADWAWQNDLQNPHRVRWLRIYAQLVRDEGYDEVADRLLGFSRAATREAKILE
jgi:hypothetical protein